MTCLVKKQILGDRNHAVYLFKHIGMKLDTRKQREREREHLQICEDETTESRTAIASERKSIGNFKKYPKTNKDDI